MDLTNIDGIAIGIGTKDNVTPGRKVINKSLCKLPILHNAKIKWRKKGKSSDNSTERLVLELRMLNVDVI